MHVAGDSKRDRGKRSELINGCKEQKDEVYLVIW